MSNKSKNLTKIREKLISLKEQNLENVPNIIIDLIKKYKDGAKFNPNETIMLDEVVVRGKRPSILNSNIKPNKNETVKKLVYGLRSNYEGGSKLHISGKPIFQPSSNQEWDNIIKGGMLPDTEFEFNRIIKPTGNYMQGSGDEYMYEYSPLPIKKQEKGGVQSKWNKKK